MKILLHPLSSLWLLLLLANTATGADDAHYYDFPSQPLSTTLNRLTSVSGTKLIYADEVVRNLQAQPLKGRFTVMQALARVLDEHKLSYERVDNSMIVIKQAAITTHSVLPEMTVKAYNYLDKETTGITNLPLPVEKVPQSISILSYDFVKSADLNTVGEIAQYTPGALWASFSPSYGNQIWLRGFAANYAIDGVTVGDQITEPDVAMLDRYEIVKGPASVVYGPQSPGGIVNLVSKRANPDTPSFASMQGGSFNRYRFDGQVSKALNASGTIRGIGAVVYQNGGSFIDFVKQNKKVAYGGLDFDLAKGMTAYVNASYQQTENTPFNGLPTYANGVQVPVPRSTFLGGSNLVNDADAIRANAGWSWDVNKLWNVGLKTIYQQTYHSGGNVYNYSPINPDGTFLAGGEHFNNWNVTDYSIAGSANRKLDDFGLTGSVIQANLRYQHYRYFINENSGSLGTAPSIFNDRAVSNFFNSAGIPTGVYQQDQRMDFITGSTQAVIKLAQPLTAVGGVSVSYPMINMQIGAGAFQNFNPGVQTQYRGSLIYEPIEGLNLYGSYSQSYQPNLRVDVNYNVLKPVQGEQYEVGAKYYLNKQLLLSAALFQINETNVAVFDQTSPSGQALYRAAGVRHRGAEFEATGYITDNWQIKAGGALLDPVVTADPSKPQSVGQVRAWLPQTTANLFTTYSFTNGFTIGGGGRYVGSVKTSYDGSTGPLSSYLVFDAMATYTYGKYRMQFNLKNLLDEHYAVPSPIFQSLSAGLFPGTPRTFMLSLRRDF